MIQTENQVYNIKLIYNAKGQMNLILLGHFIQQLQTVLISTWDVLQYRSHPRPQNKPDPFKKSESCVFSEHKRIKLEITRWKIKLHAVKIKLTSQWIIFILLFNRLVGLGWEVPNQNN